MGVAMYWYIVAAVVVLGMLLPQRGRQRNVYIVAMAILHAFVCGFRYRFLTGDLIKYNTTFQDVRYFSYFSDRVVHGWTNTGFIWLEKFISDITDGNFQVLLLVIAITVEIAVAFLVIKYSPRPWISFLAWNCLSFYIFGFSAIKQALAMALVMFAMDGVMQDNLKRFLFFTLLAGFVHFPAFAFLPAYWIAKNPIKFSTVVIYLIAIIAIYIFRNPIVNFVTSMYYEDGQVELGSGDGVGGRFLMMMVILVMGIALKGFNDRNFEKLFNILVVGAIFQMFSSYNNLFTRFADYYFQFSILYLPRMVSSSRTNPQIPSSNKTAFFRFNDRSLQLITALMAVYLIWFYDYTCLGLTISYEVDNYLNYRFMWDVP